MLYCASQDTSTATLILLHLRPVRCIVPKDLATPQESPTHEPAQWRLCRSTKPNVWRAGMAVVAHIGERESVGLPKHEICVFTRSQATLAVPLAAELCRLCAPPVGEFRQAVVARGRSARAGGAVAARRRRLRARLSS